MSVKNIKLEINYISPTEQSTKEEDFELLAKFYYIFSEIGIKKFKMAL